MNAEQESEILRLYESRAFEELERRFGSDPEASRFLFHLVRERKRGEELASALSAEPAPRLHLRLLKNALEILDASLGNGLELFLPEPVAVRGPGDEKPSISSTPSLELGSDFSVQRSAKGVRIVFRKPGLPFDIQKDGETYLKGNRLIQTEVELEPGNYGIRYGDKNFSFSVEE